MRDKIRLLVISQLLLWVVGLMHQNDRGAVPLLEGIREYSGANNV